MNVFYANGCLLATILLTTLRKRVAMIHVIEFSQFDSIFIPKDRPPQKLWIETERPLDNLICELNRNRSLAIVGARRASLRSLLLMEQTLASVKDLVIISGFAKGIDSQAHRLALKNGLLTVAFLGTGINRIYPIENRQLKKEMIAGGGAFISEWLPDSGPTPHQFVLRNRLIASFSRAIWIVEAKMGSGSLGTAKFAKDHERDVYATPCFPGDSMFAGCEHLHRNANAFPLYGADDLGTTWKDLSTVKIISHPETRIDQLLRQKFLEGNRPTLEAIHAWSEEWSIHPGTLLSRVSELINDQLKR